MTDIVEFEPHTTPIEGLWVLRLKQITDQRGTVREFYRESAFRDAGLPSLGPFAQVNITETARGAVRGIHAEAMDKLVGVVSGVGFGAYVDLRGDSPTHGVVHTVDLIPGVQVLIPRGVGNGLQALSDGGMQYLYCFDTEWHPDMPGQAITPLDPELAVPWPIPVDPRLLSDKDAAAPSLADLGITERE